MDPRFEGLSEADQQEYLRLQAAIEQLEQDNPLLGFHACPEWCGSPACPAPSPRNPLGGRPKQHDFMSEHGRIVMAAAGNRFGKTVALTVWAIIQHTPDELLPERLHEFRRERPHFVRQPVSGRYIAPTEKALTAFVFPELQRWLPKKILRGHRWDKAYSDKTKTLHFHDGGRLSFFTSEQDAKVMVGAAEDYVVIDEPTAKDVWGENWVRLTTRRGCARFGMTPVNMTGGGIGWLYRELYKPGVLNQPYEGTDITPYIVRASMDDNPDLSDQDIAEALSVFDKAEREARRTGDFVAFGGLIYPGMRKYKTERKFDPRSPEDRELINSQQVVVGIDPSYRRSAIVWVTFDAANRGLIFQVKFAKETSVSKLHQAIIEGNELWGLQQAPYYVMDPYAGGQHSQLAGAAVTMRSELQQLGIYTHTPKVLKQEAIVYGGVLNVWRRQEEGSFLVADSPTVDEEFWLESEEYRLEPRDDGVFEPVHEFCDAMDAMRYAFTTRPWYPNMIKTEKKESLEAVLLDHRAPDWQLIEQGGPDPEYPSATGAMT
jgi:hypothetical protein